MSEKGKKSVYEIAEETYEEIKKEIKERGAKADADGKIYYTPFAIGQQADLYPAREAQVDIAEQTVVSWLAGMDRAFSYLHNRVFAGGNSVVGAHTIWLDGSSYAHVQIGRWPIRHDEMTQVVTSAYNYNDRSFKGCSACATFPLKWTFDGVTNSLPNLAYILAEVWGAAYFENRGWGSGYRSHTYSIPGFGCVIKSDPRIWDQRVFPLWEGIRWKKADIKKLKANIWLAKKPTLLRAKKAEIKKIKADHWPWRFRALRMFYRWPKWTFRAIWQVKEEMKELRNEGRGEERIEEIEEQKEVDTYRKYHTTQRRYLYPYILQKEKVPLKTEEEYKEEIKKTKAEIKKMKKEFKMLIKENWKKNKEWLRDWYRNYYKKGIRESYKRPEVVELRKRWKDKKNWILEISKKHSIQYREYVGGELDAYPEIKKEVSKLYIPTETSFEREFFQEVRGDPQRENPPFGSFTLRKWRWIEISRNLGNRKNFGFGKVSWANVIDRLFCPESRGFYDFNTLIFRSAHFSKGIGEWKVLPRQIRAKIPYPLVYRPVKDKYGYSLEIENWDYCARGLWECRPLHPRDAWYPLGHQSWVRFTTFLLMLFGRITQRHSNTGWVSSGAYFRWPFDRLLLPYSLLNRLGMYVVFFRLWS